MNLRAGRNRLAILFVLAMAGIGSGCSALRHNGTWRPPQLAGKLSGREFRRVAARNPQSELLQAEADYANALAAADSGDEDCVDFFAKAALASWQVLNPQLVSSGTWSGRAGEIYHAALLGLVNEGMRYRRLDPQTGLHVCLGDGWQTIPLTYHGFATCEFAVDRLMAVGEYQTRQLNREYRCPGIGLPTIAVHCRRPDEQFVRAQQAMPTAILLRSADPTEESPGIPTLELYSGWGSSQVDVSGAMLPLARDLSAPFAYSLINMPRDYLREFLQPGQTKPDEEGLFLVHPYQPGKIPVVLSHGLISDRFTWANGANEFYARPDLVSRYQLWGFEYGTGNSFLTSAALLRRQLEEACRTFDPQGKDPALSQIVLVGHSMGGLVNKLQITSSEDRLWRAIANRSFDQVHMDDTARQRLAEACFFDPSPRVQRAIFLGTPHRGSAIAQRCIGRLGSLLVREPAASAAAHQRLIDDNPNVFSREFRRRIPTSIDLLEPTSPLLQATNCLPIDPVVATHSIIGNGYWMPGSGDSDSVVPVSSARLDRTGTEFYLHAKHTKLTQDERSIEELFRILEEHLAVCGNDSVGPAKSAADTNLRASRSARAASFPQPARGIHEELEPAARQASKATAGEPGGESEKSTGWRPARRNQGQ